jgi:hypothetical protein
MKRQEIQIPKIKTKGNSDYHWDSDARHSEVTSKMNEYCVASVRIRG